MNIICSGGRVNVFETADFRETDTGHIVSKFCVAVYNH